MKEKSDRKRSLGTNTKTHKVNTRWTTPERTAAKKIFANYFAENTEDIPSLETCQEFAFGNPNLELRSPSQIRAWIIQTTKKNV